MRGRWLTRRAFGLHLTVLVVVPAFVAMTWWQASRALDGNTLSWAYTVEWPVFAGYAVYLWWWLLHTQPAAAAERADPAAAAVAAAHATVIPDDDDQDDPELADYNRYLASLETAGRRKRW